MKLKILILVTLCIASVALATQLSFNSGQQSPLMKYRTDIDNHSMASEQLTNIIVRSKGMAFKRPGTEYVADSNSTDTVRLIPFEYSTNDAYVIEMGHNYISFFRTTP